MRCASKCSMGRPLRVYSVLLVGIVVGFVLSTLLQVVKIDSLQRTASRMNKVIDYRGSRVGFSNFEDTNIELGDYDYERMIFNDENPAPDALDTPSQPSHQKPMFDSASSSPSIAVVDDSILKQREYLNENWQGRNMRENKEESHPRKLSDELAVRHTVLIAVITTVSQLMSQTLAIQGTWGVEASQVIYFTGDVQTMPHLPHGMVVVQLEGLDDKQAGWEVKEVAALKYLVDHYLSSVEWFLVVGDETYVVSSSLELLLNRFDGSLSAVYMGRTVENVEDSVKNGLCDAQSGVVYSRSFLDQLKQYLPLCWPGQGEKHSLSGCISAMGRKCTKAQETNELFVANAKQKVESPTLFLSQELAKAVVIHPVKYPKYMYRLHSYFKELEYNTSVARAKAASQVIKETHPFIPSHLRSPFRPDLSTSSSPSYTSTTRAPVPQTQDSSGIVVRPRYVPKNKFEINYWEYFNQTRLMTIMHDSPARGIIAGIREEARYALTKAIYIANQGLSQSQRFIFDKLENGYHRIDPMRGSEYVLDFVFRRNSDRTARIKKRISILRPYHESVVPVDTPEMLPTVNFVVVLSGLSDRLEHFMMQYEQNVLQLGEDATLTIVLFESPDAIKVRLLVQQYITRYQGAKIFVIDAPGVFARGVGLHRGAEHFRDNQLLFFVDVDLDITTEFLQRCRLNTVQGKQVYFPVFFKLYHPDFVRKYHRGNTSMFISRHNGHWAYYSYGMVCIFASDYRKAGGFDTSMQGWGEEDVDFVKKVMDKGFEIFRAPDPGLIHNWHRKVCNRKSVSSDAAYEHCLQSKGENLADRIELAQYVFDNELEKGNLL